MDLDQQNLLVEKLTEGRGGAFFYYSQDRYLSLRFMLQLLVLPSSSSSLHFVDSVAHSLLRKLSFQAFCHQNHHRWRVQCACFILSIFLFVCMSLCCIVCFSGLCVQNITLEPSFLLPLCSSSDLFCHPFTPILSRTTVQPCFLAILVSILFLSK
jgi:hypothetical protein